MEVEEIERQVCKIPRLGNGTRPDSGKIVRGEDDGGGLALTKRATPGGVGDAGSAATALRGWHHSSRIIRVSRATGGKDRHSKVLTSRGLRDRRVRLSVTTAIQFYDLQDRLGYDQPSKAVEWLIKAAADAIAELPSLNTANIPETPRQLSDEKRTSDGTEQEVGTEHQDDFNQQNSQSQHFSLSKSACSSASDTSRNSGLSLGRSDVRAGRDRARERARERTAKEKEKDQDQDHQQQISHISHQNSSFTELLTCGIGNSNSHNGTGSVSPAAPMDYFGGALFSAGASSRNPHTSSGFPGQIQLRTASLAQTMSIPPPYAISADSGSSNNNNHPELQHYSFASDHLFPVAATTGSQTQQQNDYSLNFSISPGFVGFNRGTLQSNSPSLLPHHLQRLSSPLDAPPFFISTAAADHHNQQNHQFPTGFDGRGLQLCYGDTNRGADHKPKPRN